jgi:hypothetical protein
VFQEYSSRSRVFSFTFEEEQREVLSAGKTKLAAGRTKLTSEITLESDVFSYVILYLGEHNLTGAVGKFDSPDALDGYLQEIKQTYETADFPQVIRLIDRHFGHSSYSLKSLFKDEQRRILNEIMASTREDLESRFRLITERYTPLMKFLQNVGAPWPSALQTVSDFILHTDIRRQFETNQVDLARLRSLIRDAQDRGAHAFDPEMSFVVKNRLEQMMDELSHAPADLDRIRAVGELATLILPMPLGLNLWKVQNVYWEMLVVLLPKYGERARLGDGPARDWVQQFLALGERLGFAVKHLETEKIREPENKAA